MSFDLSDLWNSLQSISAGLSSFFSSIFSTVSSITNTGQGVFSGLAAFGSSLWDAIVKFGSSIAQGLVDSLTSLGAGFVNSFLVFGNLVFSTFSTLPSAIFSGLQWIYNGVLYIINSIVAFFQGAINFFVGIISSVWTTLVSAFSQIPTSVNSYFNGLVATWRAKMKLLIINNAIVETGYNGIAGLKDNFTARGIASALFSPLVGAISGAFLAELLDVFVPSGATSVNIMPTLDIPSPTLGSLSVVSTFGALAEPTPPTAPSVPTSGAGLPLDANISERVSFDRTTLSTDKSVAESQSSETSVDSTDADLVEHLTTETEVLP